MFYCFHMANIAAWGVFGWAAVLAAVFLGKSVHLDTLAGRLSAGFGGPYDMSGFGSTWLAHFRGLVGAALVLAGALGAGLPLAAWLRIGRAGRPVFAMGLGFTAMALALAGLGFNGLLHPVLLFLLVIAAIAAGWRGFLPSWRGLAPVRGGGALVAGLMTVSGLFILLYIGPALAPEMGWDAMTYHLRVPSHFLAARRICLVPSSLGSFYPFTAEMWFMLGQALGGDTAAKLVNFAFLPLTVLALACLGAEAGSVAGGWLAGLLFASLPAAGILSVQCYNDLEAAAFTVLAAWAVLRPTSPRVVLSGILCGVAAGCKYSGASVLLICLTVGWLGNAGRRARPGPLVLAALASAAVVAAWPLRNWLTTGNPVYPLLRGLFPGGGWNPYFTADEAAKILPVAAPASVGQVLAGLVRFPLDFSWATVALSAGFGPLIFGFLPFILLRFLPGGRVTNPAKASPGVRGVIPGAASRADLLLAGAGLAYAAMWVVSRAGDGRYLLPLAGLLAFPAAAGVLAAGRASRGLLPASLGLAALVAGGQGLSWLGLVTGMYEPWRNALGLESHLLYLSRGLQPHYEYAPMAELINARLPRHARILMFSDILSYYIDREVVFDTQQVMPPVAMRLVRGCRSPSLLRKRFRQLGLEWVYYTPLHVIAFQRDCHCLALEPETRSCYERFWRRYGALEFEYGGLKMFRLRSEAEAARTPASIFPVLPGVLDEAQAESEEARSAGNVSRAAEVMERFVRKNPDMWEARIRLTELLLMQGKAKEAGRELAEARRLGSDSPFLWIMLASFRSLTGDRPGMLEAARNSVQRSPTPRALAMLAVGLANSGDIPGAREAIRRASLMDPFDGEIKRVSAQLR